MLLRQSKNSYIRCTDHYGYITNQLTRHDRSYNETGADFLRTISRIPRDIDDIVEELLLTYEDISPVELKNDYIEFVESLARDCFIVIGENEQELDEKDIDFSYSIDNPMTLKRDYYQVTDEIVGENTQDFFLKEVQGRPLISNIQFELSSRCNERCIHCYIPNSKKNHGFDIPLVKIEQILDEFKTMGGIHVTLSGGEALLHKDFIEIAEYCRKCDLIITILSNLISLTDRIVFS
jgi:sulfatase maturation enzyme AslB (radical SAM superfamily)